MVSDLGRILILSGASLIDDLTTGIGCSTLGTEVERTNWRKKLMDKFGVWKSMPLQTLISQTAYYTPVIATYLMERNFNQDKEPDLYQWVWLGITCPPVYAATTNTMILMGKGIEHLIGKYSQREKAE